MRTIEGDPRLRFVRTAECRRLVVVEDGHAVVAHVAHGVWQGWHRIEVDEREDEVLITAYIGTLPEIAERQEGGEQMYFILRGEVHPVRIELTAPLAARRLRDGAAVPREHP